MADLLVEDHRVMAPDRPGYGDSPGPARGPSGNADLVAALIRSSGAGPATVVGHSYGATVALRLAELHPDTVSGLVLVCPAADPAALGPGDRLLALPGVGEVLARGAMRGAGRLLAWLAVGGRGRVPLTRLAPVPLARLGTYAARWRTGEDWRSFAVEQRALLAEMPAVAGARATVEVPTVILAGGRDHAVRPAAVARLARAVPDCAVVWAPRAGHLLIWEEPELVAATVARLARAPAS